MNLPMTWLKDYVDIDVSTKDFCDAMTLSGSKVETIETLGAEISKVVTGRVLSLEKHPDADKLTICQIDVGQGEPLQIVTGAANLTVGDIVPVALDGSTLAGGVTIKNGQLRGVPSNGMLCSVEELGCDRHDFPEAPEHGIYVFPEEVALGIDAAEAMGLREDVVEFEITSNRPDCFSIVGLAREAAATYRKELKLPDVAVAEKAGGQALDMISVEIQNPDLCPRYMARVVKNVKIAPSPRWMRSRLRAAGVRPINNIVDITNYVMLELGQPMHAFNIETIGGRHIIVRNAREGETITTLDGTVRNLDPSMLVIADKDKAVAVAGVMGGENSMVSEDSIGILLESANFNGPNVRVTAKKLGLRTDASSKFEKGLDPNLAQLAVDRAAQLVELLGAGEVVGGVVDCYPHPLLPKEMPYDPLAINKLLGTAISEDEMISIFTILELNPHPETRTLTIPTWRPDLERMADLAEEVARMHGYDKIVPTLAAGTPTVGKYTAEQNLTQRIHRVLTAQGLCEAMTYSFESPKVFDKLLIPADSELRKAVTISNPLGEDFSIMRTTTLNGMLTSLATNYNRRNEEAGLYEITRIYEPKSLPVTELPDEPEKLTIGMYGKGDFFTLKGMVESLLAALGAADKMDFCAERSIPWMHHGRTATVSIDEKPLGYVGELHPTVAKNYGIGARVYLAVLDMSLLQEAAHLVRPYKPLPKFPAVSRDISMLVPESVPVGNIEAVIRQRGGKLLESMRLFDVYQGGQIEKGRKSVSFSLTFRAADKTLTDPEVQAVMKKILNGLETGFGAILRDK